MTNRLIYSKYNNSEDVIVIGLQNGYSVIAVSGWNNKKHVYTTTLFLKKDTTDDWKLIEKAQNLEFKANYKTINYAILKKVAILFQQGFFNYYIQRCDYEFDCFDKGEELIGNGGDC